MCKLLSLSVIMIVLMSCSSVVDQKAHEKHMWLEEVEGKKAIEWVESKNDKTYERYTKSRQFKNTEKMLLKMYDDQAKIPYGSIKGKYVYNFWKDASNERGILRRKLLKDYSDNSSAWEKVLSIDELNKKEKKNWVYKGWSCHRPLFEKCLMRLSDGGKDAVTVREFDTVSKKFIEGGFFIPEAKTDISYWDANTVIVGTDWGPDSLTDSGYPRIVKILRRGQPLKKAVILFEGKKEDVSAWSSVQSRIGDKFLWVGRSPSFFTSENWVTKDLKTLTKIHVPQEHQVVNKIFGDYIVSVKEQWGEYAPGTILAIPATATTSNESSLSAATALFEPGPRKSASNIDTTKSHLWFRQNDDLNFSFVKLEKKNGAWKKEIIPIPKGENQYYFSTNVERDDFFMGTEGYLLPPTIYYRNSNGKKFQVQKSKSYFNTKGLKTFRFDATSDDGTRIPYTVIAREDFEKRGPNPTLLYGYGGFEVPMNPYYSKTIGKAWLEKGLVYVVAHIRGGGEFGPSWHRAALRENRNVAFNDFVAVAEDLVTRGITTPKKLAIKGGSNGGLLVGAVSVMRPDLFNGVLCQVPLLDMIRYNKLLAGASWMEEYGNPDESSGRSSLLKYSPLHNLDPQKKYPEIFFMTSTKDDRVHPAHARKMAKRMEDFHMPFVYYENTDGGHGGTTTNKKSAFWMALEDAYLREKLEF